MATEARDVAQLVDRVATDADRARNRSEKLEMSQLHVELDARSAAERRALANAWLRAAWSAALEETRILLLDPLLVADEAVLGEAT
jgi:hypothetical protein